MIANSKTSTMTLATILLLITALSTALVTGLLYAYSCSINPGLGQLPDKEYLLAMQSINKAILNPLFFASFMGTLLLMPCSAWLLYKQPGSHGAIILVCAWLLYTCGVFGVTMAANVPLNEALAVFDIHGAGAQDIAQQRSLFEQPWNKWHTIRTVASIISLVIILVACLFHTPAVKN